MLLSEPATRVSLARRPMAARLVWLSALREPILRCWNAACRHAERADRVVPYY